MLTNDFHKNVDEIKTLMRADMNYDFVVRTSTVFKTDIAFLFIEGLANKAFIASVLDFLEEVRADDIKIVPDLRTFTKKYIPFATISFTDDTKIITQKILSGQTAVFFHNYAEALILDARYVPQRPMREPDNDRILRGPHDGFVETMEINTALLRRHIRDTRLTLEHMQIGSTSKTDLVMCYMEGVAKPALVAKLRKKIQSISINNLTMTHQSLAECLIQKQLWYNPFPRIKYTERPDTAAAGIVEGQILVIVDNSPAAMIFPTAVFDFVQDTNDYYFPPLISTYVRFVRLILFLVTIFLTPVWYMFIKNPQWLPEWLAFITIKEPNKIPIIVQLFIIETIIEGIKMASLNMPNALTSAFSILGTLAFGEFAITAGILVSETLLYMAIVLIGNFVQPSLELGYAFKLFRLLLLLLIAIFNLWGLIAGLVLMLLILVTTKTVLGTGYLYPIIPFNWIALKRLLVRRPLNRKNAGK